MRSGSSIADPAPASGGEWIARVRRARTLLSVLAIGLVVGGVALSIMGRLEWRKLESGFHRLADTRLAAGGTEMDRHIDMVVAAGAVYEAAGDGLFVIGLIAGGMLLLIGRSDRVEQLIAAHTRKLTAINRRHEQTNLQLEHRNEEILRLCHAMTHDLQTPLASLTGAVDALEHRLGDATPDQAKWMNRIRASGRRMVAMLDDLMVYARMGTEKFERTPVDLRERVGAVLDELQPQAERKGVRIVCPDASGPPCMVLADRKLMVRVLMNLIGNAVKYIEAGQAGVVEVTVGTREELARIAVKDNGPGIAPALLDEVFQPFRRASTRTDGTGLGLSLVRRYVTAMGGRVWLESDGENGTTAVMEVPIADAADLRRAAA